MLVKKDRRTSERSFKIAINQTNQAEETELPCGEEETRALTDETLEQVAGGIGGLGGMDGEVADRQTNG